MSNIKSASVDRRKDESVYLQQFRRNVTSQCGEDGLIEQILATLGVSTKWCVEFGASDGEFFSNSWALINNEGWSAVLIEGNDEAFAGLRDRYSDNDEVVTINAFIDFQDGGGVSRRGFSRDAYPRRF